MTLHEAHSQKFRPMGKLDEVVLNNLTSIIEDVKYPFHIDEEQLRSINEWVIQDLLIGFYIPEDDGVILLKYNLERLEFISLYNEMYETTHIITQLLKLMDEY